MPLPALLALAAKNPAVTAQIAATGSTLIGKLFGRNKKKKQANALFYRGISQLNQAERAEGNRTSTQLRASGVNPASGLGQEVLGAQKRAGIGNRGLLAQLLSDFARKRDEGGDTVGESFGDLGKVIALNRLSKKNKAAGGGGENDILLELIKQRG